MKELTLGPVHIQIYGLLLAAGLCCALGWFLARPGEIRRETRMRFALLALPLGFLAARLGQCLVSQGWYLLRENYFFNFSRGGFMLYGALGGMVLAAWIAERKTGEPLGRLLDLAAADLQRTELLCRFPARLRPRRPALCGSAGHQRRPGIPPLCQWPVCLPRTFARTSEKLAL